LLFDIVITNVSNNHSKIYLSGLNWQDTYIHSILTHK